MFVGNGDVLLKKLKDLVINIISYVGSTKTSKEPDEHAQYWGCDRY